MRVGAISILRGTARPRPCLRDSVVVFFRVMSPYTFYHRLLSRSTSDRLIIIPCYNAAEHITRCLESVFGQTYAPLQVILVDDGSTDRTVEVIRGTAVPVGIELKLIEQANSGAAQARNVGLEHASGTYIQFLDADDELLPEKIVQQVKLAKEHELPDLIVGSYKVISPEGTFVRDEIQVSGPRDKWMDVTQHNMGITSALLWKKTPVVRAGGWDPTLGSSQEYDLLFRIMKNGATMAYDDALNTLVHKRNDSISHTNLAKNWSRFIELRGRIVDHVRSLNDGRDLQPYWQVIFDGIRILFAHDPGSALRYHMSLLPADSSLPFLPLRPIIHALHRY